ncbi:hypothetical protein HCN44_002957 [Aphidius gifuensis]|uniref:MATH domain-containing protein n=1 Tax=Aphidius gifuensis TaxID=684658 RepID=A0A834XQ77_APHGI|nr:hypothetical protein HCN44_002957 [Aphidius gifuensis]
MSIAPRQSFTTEENQSFTFEYDWTIKNFVFHDDKIESSEFSSGLANINDKWCLKIFPKVILDDTEFVSVQLKLLDCAADVPEIVAHYKVSILTLNNEEVNAQSSLSPLRFSSKNTSAIVRRFVKREDLFGRLWESTKLLPNDSLTILCEIKLLVDDKTIESYQPANGKTIPKVEYCNSLSCNNTARSILNNMDTSVQPCNDFLQFVCGKNRHSNDPTASKINPWKKLRNQIQENISSNDDSLVKIVKYFYKSCMITSKFDKQQLSNEIVDMIEQIGGWPVVKNDKWNSSLFNWNKTIYTYDNEKYWNLNFFDAKLEVDVKNKSQHVIYLSQSSLLQSQEFLTANFNDKNVNQDYLKLMVDVAVKMGAQYDVAINELKNCLEFGSQLVNLTDANHESMSLNDFIEEFNFFPWKEYLNSHLPTGVSINNDTIIIISSKSYMKNLEKVLNQTPKKSQANFVVWMMIHEFAEFINEPIDGNKLKSDKCLDIVTKKLVDITRVLYARNYFDKHDKEHARILIKAVKNQLIKMIVNDKWTDEKSKAMTIDKIKININDNFYQEHNLRELENIIEEYNGLKIDQYNFVKNYIKLNLFKLKWTKFNKTAFDLSWDSFASGLLYSDTILIGPGSLNNNTLGKTNLSITTC